MLRLEHHAIYLGVVKYIFSVFALNCLHFRYIIVTQTLLANHPSCENFKKLRAVMKGIFTVGYAENDEKFNKVTDALSKVTTLFRFIMIEYNTE